MALHIVASRPDPALVRLSKSVSDLENDVDRLSQIKIRLILESSTCDVFHNDEAVTRAVAFYLIDFVDSRYVRMVERRGSARLAQESLSRQFVLLRFGKHQFERDRAMQLEVFGLVDLAHAANAEALQNPIV